MSAPIAAADIWSHVMDQARDRCQCPAKHHSSHRYCPCETDTRAAALIAGPVIPGPHPERRPVAVPVTELIAWCPRCWDETVRDARRQARAAERTARRDGLMAGLFDLAEVSA